MNKILSGIFNGSAAYKTGNSLMATWRRFAVSVGLMPCLAVDKKTIFDWVATQLEQKNITSIQGLAFLSANVLVHSNSLGDEDDYIHRAIKLYNAPYSFNGMIDICEADGIEPNSAEYAAMLGLYSDLRGPESERIQMIKEARYADDILKGSRRELCGVHMPHDNQITAEELAALPHVSLRDIKKKRAIEKAAPRQEKLPDGTVAETYALLDIDTFYPLLLRQRKANNMTESQAALFLCFILHGLETRGSGESYIDHPMAVAGMVQKFGHTILSGRKNLIWRATLAALLHDVGEHTNFKVSQHLKGLLSPEVANDTKELHRKMRRLESGEVEYLENYFEYVQRIAENPVTALVKLCDIAHNTDGHPKTRLKQDYVYRLAAGYLRASIERPHETAGISVRDWALKTGICRTAKDFERIEKIAMKDESENGANIGFTLKMPVNAHYLSEIRSPQYANPRRKEGIHLQY